MKIYTNYLNEIGRISLDINAYEEENFKNTLKKIEYICEDMFNEITLRNMCKKAILQYCRQDNDYVIHKFKEYYAISRITDLFYPEEIDNEILVFDKNRIYPIQEITINIDFKYYY